MFALAALLAACGGSDRSSDLRASLVEGEGLSRDEFVETSEALCKESYFDRIGAEQDIKEFERLIIRDVRTIRWTIQDVRALIRHVRGYKESVRQRLRIGREQLVGLYGLEPPSVGRGAVDTFLGGWNESWLHLRKAAQHLFLGDVDNYRAEWKEARTASRSANTSATDFGMGDECISSWTVASIAGDRLIGD